MAAPRSRLRPTGPIVLRQQSVFGSVLLHATPNLGYTLFGGAPGAASKSGSIGLQPSPCSAA